MKNVVLNVDNTRTDRHPADIKADLEKAGWSLRRLSVHHGFKPESLAKALRQSWPRAEALIAEAIGQLPEDVWPSRYAEQGPSFRRLQKRTDSSKNKQQDR